MTPWYCPFFLERRNVMDIEVFTQSAIKLTGKQIIYFDPIKIKEEYHDADYIFITHDHYDHFEGESIKKLLKDQTYLIVPKILEDKAKKITDNVLIVEPNKTYQLNELEFRTIPAYNLNKTFHLKENGYVGYNLKLDDKYYYIMGDTDVTEEAKEVKADICFIPIGGHFTMDFTEAADYINLIKPKEVIPIHYGSIIGDISDGEEFAKLVDKDIEVKIYIKEEK